jgi:hypothetical protein
VAAVIWLFLNLHENRSYSGSAESLLNCKDFEQILAIISEFDDMPPCVVMNDIKHELKYRPKSMIYRPVVHIGQRKLLDNEIQFLTNSLPTKDAHAFVIYAGSSPSNHIYLLHKLFPNVKFILVDPRETLIYTKKCKPHYSDKIGNIVYIKTSKDDRYDTQISKKIALFDHSTGDINIVNRKDGIMEKVDEASIKFIKESNFRIYIIEDVFSDELAGLLREIGKLYFWSDIRTSGDESPTDLDILWDLAQQYVWLSILQPEKYMIKFRVPFFSLDIEDINDNYLATFDKCRNTIDFVKNYSDKKMEYISGEIYIQPFAGVNSTETRLVGSLEDITNIRNYDTVKYEDKFYYYNNIERPIGMHINPISDVETGYDHCGDCSLEYFILSNYRDKIDPQFDIADFLKKIDKMTNKSLKWRGHGNLFPSRGKGLVNTIKWYKDIGIKNKPGIVEKLNILNNKYNHESSETKHEH